MEDPEDQDRESVCVSPRKVSRNELRFRRFGIALRPWQEQLEDCLARMQERRSVLIG